MQRLSVIALALICGFAAPAKAEPAKAEVENYASLSPEKRAARSTNDFGHALFGRLGEDNVSKGYPTPQSEQRHSE